MLISSTMGAGTAAMLAHKRLSSAPPMCVDRPRIEECLPPDALEAILGYLDQENLCTARLVSKTFCAAASAHVSSLALASTSRGVSFHHYPHLRHLIVSHNYYGDLESGESLAQLDPCLRDLATALTIEYPTNCMAGNRDYLSQAAAMPKLQKLTVKGHLQYDAALLARCTNPVAIDCQGCSIYVARAIVTMRQLTSFCIGSVLQNPAQAVSARVSWLEHATNLRNLRALCISIQGEALPLIGNLTSLTGLTLSRNRELKSTYSIAPLIGLTSLRSFGSGMLMTESNLGISGSLGSGSLANLELEICEKALADAGKFLSRQTDLTRLSLGGWWQRRFNFQPIGGLCIELLQCLKIDILGALEADGLSVLSRATSLSSLCIKARITQPLAGLSQVLARLTQLRSLILESRANDATKVLDLPLAMSPLTGLTKLTMRSHGLDDGDFGALLNLTGLRVLELEECRLTDAMLPQLGILTNLKTLRVGEYGVTSLAPVQEMLDPLRKARGLPPLCAQVVLYR